jgi:hypothetical protein
VRTLAVQQYRSIGGEPEEIQRIARKIRTLLPEVKIVLRGDSGFAGKSWRGVAPTKSLCIRHGAQSFAGEDRG